ncbi:L-ascorbate metabolism protein UlaG (beta-lactamase superfamily) [Catenuloplanes nepalensis]|uniref:L-ascorbate metabolism protein UlaG (Beta-lactamase superfamily) n=1 Tax=Catenuloplanes nepalensis TaxID=587533 RepID=A0ABT9MPI7_9ACTN|nr:MBL fold metallo-hydrolase [Catenuloplanes nepalensis]MDP9793349.1 L-ascorbate metabolism protein UlaG (beta-lactamase superfamily) [Catenuloplanes nepalensis]
MDVRASVTYIGNATTLLRLGGFTLLTDPAFRPAGSRYHLGYGAWTKRVLDPACGLGDLPPLSGVLLSHLHSDHFDRAAARGLAPDLPIITTPQARRKLRRKRFSAVHGLPAWEQFDTSHGRERLRVTAVPGRHGPGLADHLLPDVMGSVVELFTEDVCRLRLYVTGDTLFRPMLAEVPRRCGDIDAMLIHLGGTRLLGMLLTMDARQGANLTEVIRPRLTLPIHHEDFSVFTSPVGDFFDRARARGLAGVEPIGRGDTVTLPLRSGTGA